MHRARLWIARSIMSSALILGVAGLPAFADEGPSLEERANRAFSGADWEQASKLYLALSQASSDDPAVWFRLGLATLNSEGDPVFAIKAYRKAIDLGFRQGPALFGIARAHAINSDETAALETLARLAEVGPSRGIVRRLESDEAFDSLRSNNEFTTAVRRLTPCSADEYRQFDFWLGEWEVQSPQAQVVGKNTISESLDGCLLIENWESVRGFKGLSINYFDNSDKTWNQTFRDNNGNVSGWPDLKGSFRQGSMVLESPPGETPRARWTWTEVSPGKVRQTAESSTDGGETWTITWDSYYLRTDGPVDRPHR